MPPIVRPRRCLRHVPLARDDLRSFCPERLRSSACDEGDRGSCLAIKNGDVSMDAVFHWPTRVDSFGFLTIPRNLLPRIREAVLLQLLR